MKYHSDIQPRRPEHRLTTYQQQQVEKQREWARGFGTGLLLMIFLFFLYALLSGWSQ